MPIEKVSSAGIASTVVKERINALPLCVNEK